MLFKCSANKNKEQTRFLISLFLECQNGFNFGNLSSYVLGPAPAQSYFVYNGPILIPVASQVNAPGFITAPTTKPATINIPEFPNGKGPAVLPPLIVNPVLPPAPVIPPPAPLTPIETGNANAPLKAGSCFYLKNAKNGQYITFGNNSMEIAWSSGNPGGNENVCVEDGPGDAYFIHWKREWNRVFDIFEGRHTDGTRLIKFPKHGGVNQQFRFKRNSAGQYQFIAVNSNKAFGIWGNGIAQSTPTDDLAQFWNVIPA